jgi:hypothetical protein
MRLSWKFLHIHTRTCARPLHPFTCVRVCVRAHTCARTHVNAAHAPYTHSRACVCVCARVRVDVRVCGMCVFEQVCELQTRGRCTYTRCMHATEERFQERGSLCVCACIVQICRCAKTHRHFCHAPRRLRPPCPARDRVAQPTGRAQMPAAAPLARCYRAHCLLGPRAYSRYPPL